MSRTIGFLILFAIVAIILVSLHYYFWVRLVRDPQLTGFLRHLGTGLAVALPLLIVATIAAHELWPSLGRILAWPGFIWMGAMFILFVILLGIDAVRLVSTLGNRWLGTDDLFDGSRRVLTARILAGAALAGVGGIAAAAIRATQGQIAVKRIEIVLDRLPASLDGKKIVQICDLHVGGLLGRSFVERVVRTINGLGADVVAVVGDVVDGTISNCDRPWRPLRPCARATERSSSRETTRLFEIESAPGWTSFRAWACACWSTSA